MHTCILRKIIGTVVNYQVSIHNEELQSNILEYQHLGVHYFTQNSESTSTITCYLVLSNFEWLSYCSSSFKCPAHFSPDNVK